MHSDIWCRYDIDTTTSIEINYYFPSRWWSKSTHSSFIFRLPTFFRYFGQYENDNVVIYFLYTITTNKRRIFKIFLTYWKIRLLFLKKLEEPCACSAIAIYVIEQIVLYHYTGFFFLIVFKIRRICYCVTLFSIQHMILLSEHCYLNISTKYIQKHLV